MKPSTEPTARELFLEISAMSSPDERTKLMDEICGDFPDIRHEVEALLAEEAAMGDFLESAAIDQIPHAEEPKVIGPYKLLQEIGEGGCGMVYLAEQERPVRRRVALKVIKLGMDTKSVIARFESERQALALMEHPNIATVLDAGTTETGRPFFVMELVRGVPITDYCDQHTLSIQERLQLFIQVTQAIQHAHQKGIIHRDIKPSNILVTENDGIPVPKIIDFGIAKATEQRLTDKTLFTEFQSFIGTPAYMSPEQAEMSSLDVDTRSDIYSLGVLLYEMLAGTTPFDAQALRESGIDACRQTIRTEEPDRPSQRVSTLAGDALSLTAQHRGLEAPRLGHALRGDLDWIVMKCLEKDRQRRYATANALTLDLERYLEGELVLARPPSTLYRLQKSFRRHRGVVIAGGTVALTLIGAVGVSSWLAWRAMKAEAQASAAQSEQVTLREIAERDREQAEASAASARLSQYVAEMNLAFQALGDGNLGRAFQLLQKHQGNEPPDFVWRYLRKLCEGDPHEALIDRGPSILDIAFDSSGELLAVATVESIEIWDLALRSRIIQLPATVRALTFSPNGETLYTGDERGIRSWNTTSWLPQSGPADRTEALTISPDGRRLLTGDHSRIRLYDTASWVLIWEKRESTSPIAFSPNGTHIASNHRDGLQIILAANGSRTHLLEGSDLLATHSVLFHHQGRQVFAPHNVTSTDGIYSVGRWDAGTGRELTPIPPATDTNTLAHTSAITDLAIDPRSRTLATVSRDHAVGIWDLESGRQLGLLRGHHNEVLTAAFAPSGNALVTGSGDGALLLWPNKAPETLDAPSTTGFALSFSPDGSQILEIDPERQEWQIRQPQRERASRSWPLAADGPLQPSTFAVSHDFSTAVQVVGKTLHRWELATGKHTTHECSQAPQALHLSPDGHQLITRARDHATWWTLTEASLTEHLGMNGVEWATFSDDGHCLITFTSRGFTQVIDANTREISHTFAIGTVGRGRALSIDGSWLATSRNPSDSDHGIDLWDTETGERLQELIGHKQRVAALAFSPDRRILASASDDSTLKFWHLESGRELLSLRDFGRTFHGLRFSPDGQWLLGNTGGLGRAREVHLIEAPMR